MKKLLALILFLGLSISGRGQDIKVKYQFYLNDSLYYDKMLYLGTDTSVWQDYEETKLPNKERTFVINNLKTNTQYSKHIVMMRENFISDTTFLAHQNWTLTPETKTLVGQPCNSAETVFREVRYRVFYAPNIPTQLGPWKFAGLPGLILEARSLESVPLYHFVATEITNHAAGGLTGLVNKLTKDKKWISWDEYKIIFKKIIDNVANKIKSGGSLPVGASTRIKLGMMEIIYPEAQTGEGLLIQN